MIRKIIIPSRIFEELRGHLLASRSVETHAFLFGGFSDTTITVGRLWKTAPDMYERRSEVIVDLSREYVIKALEYARQNNFALIDAHSHPWASEAVFSATDDRYGIENAEWVWRKSKEGVFPRLPWGMLLMAGSGDMRARVYDYEARNFAPVMVQTPLEIGKGKDRGEEGFIAKPLWYDRQIRVWGEEGQKNLQLVRVAIVGLGGLGVLVALYLSRIGVKRFFLIDGDKVEPSNLSRLIGFFPEDVGRYKVEVIAENIKRLIPDAEIESISEYFGREHFVILKDKVDFLIGTVDREGARLLMNEFSVRYLVPYIDVGSGIHLDSAKKVVHEMGAQIRVVNPGSTPCLSCYKEGIDPVEASLDLSPFKDIEVRRALGYVEGTSLSPEPSVIPLNGTIASMATAIFSNIVTGFSRKFPQYLVFDALNYEIKTFSNLQPEENCSVCGFGGYLGIQSGHQTFFTEEEQKRIQQKLQEWAERQNFPGKEA